MKLWMSNNSYVPIITILIFFFILQNREMMEKLEELETSNNHLLKRLDKLKNAKSALLKDLWPKPIASNTSTK